MMATLAYSRRLTGEPRFFFFHAAALTLVAIGGFGFAAASGQASYGTLPWTLYLHGLVFFSWCAIAMAQPWLIAQGDRATHRRIGWLAGVLALVMGFSGVAVTIGGVAAGRLSPANIWLAMNILTVVPFLALIGAGIAVRRTTDWHRRLLASATALVTAPAWPRILPMEWLGPFGIPVITALVLAFIVWGMVHDRRTRGRIHPAWWWGAAGVAAPGVLTVPLALAPSFARWAEGFAPT